MRILSRSMTKPTKWPVRPAKTRISLGIHQVWSESTLKKAWILSYMYPLSVQRILWSDWADTQTDLYSLGRSCCGSVGVDGHVMHAKIPQHHPASPCLFMLFSWQNRFLYRATRTRMNSEPLYFVFDMVKMENSTKWSLFLMYCLVRNI